MDLIEAIKRGQFNINGFQNPSNEQPQNENTNLINAIKTGNFHFPKIEPPQPTFDDIQNNYNQSLGALNQARFDYQQGLNKLFANNNVSFDARDTLKSAKPTQPFTFNTPIQKFDPTPKFNEEGYKKSLEEMQPQQEVVNQKLNDYKYNEFLKNQAEIEQEDTSFYDKTLGTLVRGGKDLFSGFEDRSYITPEGQTTYLPTRNELKQQKVSQDYDTKLGKMLGDTAYNVAKIEVSNVLDRATGGVGGKALYWGDMFTDNLKNAVNEGYDKESAILYSTIGSATEFLTGKFLGSATKGLTGGKTSEVSQLISKVTNKLIKNDAVSNLIGNMGSEGVEEFTQEYIDNFNKLITLEKSKNPKDYLNVIKDKQVLEDAMYSAAVGALSGGLTNVGEFATDIRKPQINPVLEQNNLNNTITPQAQETSTGSLKTSALDYNIDTNNETITSIDRMMSERGINSKFDDKLFDNNNINAFWRTNEDGTREVIFNPNANTEDMLENTAVHELYHDLVNQEGKGFLQDLILSMDSTKQDSLQAREMLKQEYAKVYDVNNPDFDNMVNEEATAIILGKKLGNQEFINELTTTNKGVARKIYDAVVSMLNKLNKLTGYKFEKLYWTDVKNKFENAYRNTATNQGKTDTRYSSVEDIESYGIQEMLNKKRLLEEKIEKLQKSGDNTWIDYENELMKLEDAIERKKGVKYSISSNKDLKSKQFDILQKSNPMLDDYHTGIRSPQDIKSFEETLDDDESFVWGDFSREDAEKAVKSGNITVYSSYPIEQGVFVSTSKNQARDYAGGGKIYEKTIPLNEVAWINGDEGQYAKVGDTRYSISNSKEYYKEDMTIDEMLKESYRLVKTEEENYMDKFRELDRKIKAKKQPEKSNAIIEPSKPVERKKDLELSKEQQEFFKDSKIRDDKGKLKVVYHGTNSQFNKYKRGKKGYLGGMIYLTDSLRKAEKYTDYGIIKKQYVNIKNPLVITEVDAPKKILETIYGNDKIYKNRKDKASFDTEIITNRDLKKLQEMGYDGIEWRFGGESEYAVFNSNQIKNVDNTNPTENEDIRYSKGITSYQDYVNKNYKSTGTGNKLKDIRKPKEKPKEKIALVEVAKPMAKSGEKVAKPVKETPKKVVKTEPAKKEIVRLTAEQEQELNVLRDVDKAFGLEGEDLKRYNELKAIEDKSIIHKDLIGKTSFNKVKKEYGKYKNSMDSFNDKQLQKSEENILANKQGRRTKEQWLDVAEILGENIKDMDTKDLEKYAIQSFIYAQPNHVENLNRQGKKYVSFGINEWLERVYKGAGVGEKYSIDTTTRDIPKETKKLTPKTTSDEIFESVKPGNKESKFFENVTEKSKFLTEDNRKKLSNEDIKYYQSVTNEESMNQAKERLDKGGVAEINRWLVNDNKGASDSIDVAEGWILLKRAQDNGDYDTMVSVAKKMKEMGTKSGQAIQMYNLMSRLTPEGMVKYATSELNEAWKAASKNKSKDWVDKYVNDFELTPEETRFIVDTMKKVETMEDGRAKQVELAKIQKMLSDKLPPEKGSALKSWMRISMLFNPKTQVRNVLGNAVIMPVNTLADATASLVDKQIAKKTGVRTTGLDKAKNIVKGAKKGAFESYEDFKLGINTRDMQGNKFEVGEGKAFNEKHEGLLAKPRNELSKGLNKVDSILNFVMDAGDRVFYEGIFTNSINNQLELNNTKEVTQDIIDIATQEALAKTWNDNNEYTKFVLNIRGMMNKLHVKGYGIGDVLIPFAKTPANLTKAIVDYSPVGLVKSLTSNAVKLKNNIATGTITAQQQHEFVQNLGKGFAGSLLYILGYGLAKAGVTSGANDDDKDVSDFMRNTLGIQPYSIKIGDKSFTYDWAQPVAAPFGFTADAVKNKKENASLTETLTSVLDTGFNMLLEQSFLSGIKDVLGSRGSKVEGIFNQILGLPARAVPTFIKQINDMIDPNVKMSYEKNKPIESAKNQVRAKIPGQSQDLALRRDTLGREVKKFGGDNNVFNVFLNPANVSKGKPSLAGKEIYEVYQQTKDKRIMPRYPASVLNLTNKEQSEFLKISGQIIEDNVQELNSNNYYRNLSYEDKAEAIKGIVDFAYNKAKARVTKSEISNVYKKANRLYESGEPLYDYYAERVYNKK